MAVNSDSRITWPKNTAIASGSSAPVRPSIRLKRMIVRPRSGKLANSALIQLWPVCDRDCADSGLLALS